ncbi:MAG: hypothetical protein V1793_18770 [Pseudomonadota bacterium]
MSFNFKTLTDNLDGMYRLQERQIHEFNDNLVPDIARQSEERNQAFADLKEQLTAFLITAGGEEKDAAPDSGARNLELCRKMVEDLIRQNQEMKSLIMGYKQEIQQAMTKINQGKRVLHSYQKGVGPSPAPKVMSLNS